MTISSSEIKRNMTILLDNEVYQIIEWQHRQAPKAPPTLTLKVRQLSTGNVYERKMAGNHKLTLAPTEERKCQFLYQDGSSFHFMDNSTYDQYELLESLVGDARNYLGEGTPAAIRFYNDTPITIDLPAAVELTVTEASTGLKGDTQGAATKPVTTNTGLVVNVPLFIEEGDKISVNTGNGSYAGRV